MQNLQEQWIEQLSALLEEISGAVFTASAVVPATHSVELLWAEMEVEIEARAGSAAQRGRFSVGAPDFVVTQIAQLAAGEPLDPGVDLVSEHRVKWGALLERCAERLAAAIEKTRSVGCRVRLLRLGERPEIRDAAGPDAAGPGAAGPGAAGPDAAGPGAASTDAEGERRTAWVIQGGNAELHLELAGRELGGERPAATAGKAAAGTAGREAPTARRSGDGVGELPGQPPLPQAPPKPPAQGPVPAGQPMAASAATTGNQRLDLLLDVELEATLRFGSRELPLREVLDLGPGDVIQLDRHVHEPVDLIVGDKIVARGEVVLVNGNFGLRVTQVAEPKSRLESVRCLF